FHPEGAGMSASGPQLLVATLIAFVVGWAAVSWFLKFLVSHSMPERLGGVEGGHPTILVLLATGVLAASS
ncbi:undecaprenyl-diphosphatase, partial [Mycobacterium stomatepiae]|nr:undecaprenyl-diphosphatase [Mycobacterium stomatepiae]